MHVKFLHVWVRNGDVDLHGVWVNFRQAHPTLHHIAIT